MSAILYNRELDIINLLLKNTPDINHQNKSGNTPLTIAAQWSSLEILELLLKNGADINHKNTKNNTARDIAHKHFKAII